MPNLVWIHPVLWTPNPNKQTDRQTDRHTSLLKSDWLSVGRFAALYCNTNLLTTHWPASLRTAAQKVPQKDSTLLLRPHGESLDFLSFPKLYPSLGGQPKKVLQGYPQGPWGRPCKIWLISIQYFGVQIRTNKQTGRQAGLFYMYRYVWTLLGS